MRSAENAPQPPALPTGSLLRATDRRSKIFRTNATGRRASVLLVQHLDLDRAWCIAPVDFHQIAQSYFGVSADDSLGSLKAFLDNLKDVGRVEKIQSWVAHVDAIMKRIENDQQSVLKGLPRPIKKQVGAMSIICWWLSQKRLEFTPEGNHFNTHDLMTDFGYVPAGSLNEAGEEVEVKKGTKYSNRGALTRCLPLGYESLKDFFEYLETPQETLPSPLCDVGLFWWNMRCDGRNISAPQCVRQKAGDG